MDSIKDIDCYVKSMSTTMLDKCWFLDKLPDRIDTIVDFGCANGDLAIMVDRLFPGRFKYIGIDNSPEMLAMARHNHFLHFRKDNSEFYSEISGISQHCDMTNTVLVLNSVMHEIFSYLRKNERDVLLSELFGAGFAFVAIRDMYSPSVNGDLNEDCLDTDKALKAIERSRFAKMWGDYWEHICNDPIKSKMAFDKAFWIAEFLMKYRYVSNWEREKKEQYFHPWMAIQHSCEECMLYDVRFEEDFYIPFIRDRIHMDFGIWLDAHTHKKVLLEKNYGRFLWDLTNTCTE